MNRRHFLTGSAASWAVTHRMAAAPSNPAFFELRYYRLRNGPQIERTNQFLSKTYLPAAIRAGAGPVGFFGGLVAPQMPFVLALTGFRNLSAMESALNRMAADPAYQKGADAFDSMSELSYIRMESSLFRGFRTFPNIQVPPVNDGQAPRVYELRIYEANHAKASQRKIGMFDEGEIDIFRKCKMTPVFFGDAIAGANLPNLTYMLAFDSLAAREEAWKTFINDPDWQKLRVKPGLSDAEIVSNISGSMLRPMPYSPIR